MNRRQLLRVAAVAPWLRPLPAMQGTHPTIVFSAADLPALQARATSSGMPGDAYRRLRQQAVSGSWKDLTVKEAVGREGIQLAQQLTSLALAYQVEGDERLGRQAAEWFQSAASRIDPVEFHQVVDSNFFATEHWPKAFAFAWDWLYPVMTDAERNVILPRLLAWSSALFAHTEHWWWRDATINCGAIPVGAQGLLLTAIHSEAKHPDFEHWFSTSFRKCRDNYFATAWRSDGICNEGPGYAHYHRNPTQFADAVRRTGGPDIIPAGGAVNAMHYLRHQWMPQGGCGPIGDNTEYGRRVFQGIYLLGIRELKDRAGLWTFQNFTDPDRIDPVEIFLYWPYDLEPVSPGKLDLPVSHYFEIDKNRAGTVFARSEWDNSQAHWFAFVTRYAEANHTHYDMNSFLFTAFGEPFATHANVFPYSHKDHGVDFEHNIVIIGEGGMPAADRSDSAGDDGSINGFLAGVGLGHFADYVRGDARLSYADPTVPSTTPALRADRSILFVKQGANPYVVIADQIQKDEHEHDYHWQWYTEAKSISGAGTFVQPFLIEAANATCLIAFHQPADPQHDSRTVSIIGRRSAPDLGLLRVNQRGVRARYLAIAAAWRKGSRPPSLRPGPAAKGSPDAASLAVEGDGFRDLIIWQPESSAKLITAGSVKTDALMALVRTDSKGVVVGYAMGDGRRLDFNRMSLVQSKQTLSVSVDEKLACAFGPRRAREGQPPSPAAGTFRLLKANSAVWADGTRITSPSRHGLDVTLPGIA